MKLTAKLAVVLLVVVAILAVEFSEAHSHSHYRRYRRHRHHRYRYYRCSRTKPTPAPAPVTPAPVPVIPQSVLDLFNLLAALNLMLFNNLLANTLPPVPIIPIPLQGRRRRSLEIRQAVDDDAGDECSGRELPDDIKTMLSDMKEGKLELDGPDSEFRCFD